MQKLNPGPAMILIFGSFLLILGGLSLWVSSQQHFHPDEFVDFVKDRQNPKGYFVSNPDLLYEPSELNANSMKNARFSTVTLTELGSIDKIDKKAVTDYVMGNYIEDETHAGFRKTKDASTGVRTTLDAIMALEAVGALNDPRLDLDKVDRFIRSHQNPDGGFWDEDYSKYGKNSTLICTSFSMRALGRIANYKGQDFDQDFRAKVAGFVGSNYDEGFGGYSNTPGGDPTDSYGIFRGFISLWWLGGDTIAEKRAFVEGHMDMERIIEGIETNYLHDLEGAYCRESDTDLDCKGVSLKASHLFVWFLSDMGYDEKLDQEKLIEYTLGQSEDGQYEDVYTLYAAILMFDRLDAKIDDEVPHIIEPVLLKDISLALVVMGLFSFGAALFIQRRVQEIKE
jgi:prenyltransferase beta subunit